MYELEGVWRHLSVLGDLFADDGEFGIRWRQGKGQPASGDDVRPEGTQD